MLALSVTMGCAGSVPAATQPAPLREVQTARAFTGADGLRVEALDFADGSALVRIVGIESELAGKVLSYERVQNGDRLEYRSKWHGRDLYALVRERDGRWVAYVPGTGEGHPLTYQEDKSATVDDADIQRTFAAQSESGELAALQRFDRDAEQRGEEQALAEQAASVAEKCKKAVPMAVQWSSVRDEQLIDKSVSGYCGSLLSALERLCEHDAGRRFVAAQVSSVECALDGDNKLTRSEGRLRWAINFDITNADQRAYGELLAITPAGAQQTLEQQLLEEQTQVCADADRKHVVVLGPAEAPHRGFAYGDGSTFSWVRTPAQLGGGWFFDPRQRNERNNESFRGLDLRLYSHIDVDAAAGSCKLTCGARERQLSLVTGADKSAILSRASYAPGPMQREPYALARDKAGTYYFVDRGVTEQTARDYRLYRGPRGRLRLLAMKDVVSDSEGEIFASSGGKLRLVLGKQAAQWIAGQTTTLLLLPLEQNQGLIYNELGVYLGERLGVPCDDL